MRTLAQSLSVTFGSTRALVALRETLADRAVPGATRRSALDSLLGVKDAELPVEAAETANALRSIGQRRRRTPIGTSAFVRHGVPRSR